MSRDLECKIKKDLPNRKESPLKLGHHLNLLNCVVVLHPWLSKKGQSVYLTTLFLVTFLPTKVTVTHHRIAKIDFKRTEKSPQKVIWW